MTLEPLSPDYYTFNFPIGAQVAPGGIYIVAHPTADPIILAVADMTWDGAPGLSNGDDAYFLVNSSTDTTIVDAIGDFGPDPGSVGTWLALPQLLRIIRW